jgi:uncharacterized protein (DUF983 family)
METKPVNRDRASSYPQWFLMLRRALVLRCPVCGTRWLFVHWLKLRPACAECGQSLERLEEGGCHYLGALVLNFAVAESLLALVVLVTILATWPAPPWTLLVYGGVALAVIAPVAFYPFSKLLWLAIDLSIQPRH